MNAAIFRWSPQQPHPHSPSLLNFKTQKPPKIAFLLLILILIQAGIVSPVYVRLVIIVVINDSSILTTGLNSTLWYLQSAVHNTREIQLLMADKYQLTNGQIWIALVRSGEGSATIGTESDPLSLCIWPSPVCIPVLSPLLAIHSRPPKKPTNGNPGSSQSESNDRK